MSVRTDFAEQLADDWADLPVLDTLRVVASERDLDVSSVPTALIRLKSISKFPEAPLTHRNHNLTLTLISPRIDADAAADELEELAYAALNYLDTRYLHDEATFVGYGERLAFDIPITIAASKDAPTSED